MKRIFAMLLCLMMLVTLFAGCNDGEETQTPTESSAPVTEPTETEPDEDEETEYEGIAYNGLYEAALSPDDVVQAEGREADVTVDGEDDSTTMIYHDGECFGIAFDQVQYSIFDDHTQVTCCYALKEGESMEEVLETMRAAVTAEYGEGTDVTTSGGTEMTTWSDGVTNNRVRLYPLNETDIRLQFTLGF